MKRRANDTRGRFCRGRRTGEARSRGRGSEKQDVIGVKHRAVRLIPMRVPDRSAIERFQRPRTSGHIGESPEPHEPVWIVEIPEGSHDVRAELILRVYEMPLEDRDQRLAL